MRKINLKNIYRLYLIVLFCVVVFIPKISILNIAGSRTGIRLDDILILIYFISFIIRLIRNPSTYLRTCKTTLMIIICMFSFGISNIFGIISNNITFLVGLLHLLRTFEYFVFIFAGIDLYNITKDSKHSNILLSLLKISIVIHGIYAILEYFGITPDIGVLIGRPPNDRVYTTFSGPYELGGYLSIAIVPIIYELVARKRKLNLFYVLLALATIVLSKSRVALIAFIIVIILPIIILSFKHRKNTPTKPKHRVSKRLIITLGCMLAVLLFFAGSLSSRFKDVNPKEYIQSTICAFSETDFEYYKMTKKLRYNDCILENVQDYSFSFRITKWATLIKAALIQNPLFGLGMSISGEGMDGSYVKLLCETGIIGLTLWLIMLATLFKTFKQNNSQAKYIAYLVIIALIVNAVFIDIFDASKVMMAFWMIIGYYLYYVPPKSRSATIIHVVDGLNNGGVEEVLYNYYQHDKKSDDRILILSHSPASSRDAKRFNNFGIEIRKVTPKRKNIIKNFTDLYSIINAERPDIVHVHMTLSSYMALFAAWLNGVPVRIYHSHLSKPSIKYADKIKRSLNNSLSNYKVACTAEAADYAFGKRSTEAIILPNAFSLEKYEYNQAARNEMRKKLKIGQHDILIGNAGRFTEQKNQAFLVDVLKEIDDPKYRLILIGDGELKQAVINKAAEKRLSERVIFVEPTSHIADYYSAMDIFAFPSNYEGLGIALVEAQISGLPCLVSKNVPSSAIFSKKCIILDTNSPTLWAKTITSIEHPEDRNATLKDYSALDINVHKSQLSQLHHRFIQKEGGAHVN